jgi:Putative restriction endonuclease
MATTVAVPLRIGPADHGRTMTLEEFREANEEDGYRYELARGVLEVSEVPNDPHGVVVANLYDGISRYRRDHPGVILRYGGGNEFRFWLPHIISGRNPDLGVVLLAHVWGGST